MDDSGRHRCYAQWMTIYLHEGDLPHDVFAPGPIAVDSETMGLHPHRDRLCLLQLADGQGDEHLVRFTKGQYDAPVLKRVLADPARLKLFHFARFDLAVIKHYRCSAPRSRPS